MHPLLEKYLQAVKDILPQNTPTPSVGLDIGMESCKAVELIKKGDSFEILRWAVETVENENLEGAVRKICGRLNITSKAPYTAVSGKGTLIRFIDMPRMSVEDLKKSFDIESDRYFPFPKEQIYTNCYILDQESQDKQMSVLVAAAKKDIIQERMKLLSSLGLPCSFIGVNSIAVANVFHTFGKMMPRGNPSKERPSGAAAVLDMGETASNLMVMVGHRPRFNRDIFVGGRDLTKRVSNLLGMGLPEAKALKTQPADRLNEILNACDSVLMNLVSEVRFSFDYFTTEYNMPIARLFLSGGASLLQGVPELFSKNLDIPVERWNPIQYLKLAPGVSEQEIQKHSGLLGVALGLALYEYD